MRRTHMIAHFLRPGTCRQKVAEHLRRDGITLSNSGGPPNELPNKEIEADTFSVSWPLLASDENVFTPDF